MKIELYSESIKYCGSGEVLDNILKTEEDPGIKHQGAIILHLCGTPL